MGWMRAGSRSLAALGGLCAQDCPQGWGVHPGMAGKVTGLFPRTRPARGRLPAFFPLLRLPSRHMARRPRPGSGSGRQTATAGLLLPARQEGTRRAGWLLRAPACAPGVSPRSRALPEPRGPRLAAGLGLQPGFLGSGSPPSLPPPAAGRKGVGPAGAVAAGKLPRPNGSAGFWGGEKAARGSPAASAGWRPPGTGRRLFPTAPALLAGSAGSGGKPDTLPCGWGGEGAGPTPSGPPQTRCRGAGPGLPPSFGQLRPTPPLPPRILRAAGCPPFTRGTGSRAPLVTPDMSVGRVLMDSTPNPHFPSNKSASSTSVCGLSLQGVPKLLL
ncbi:unnamed protein product, partial [Coccothraustes coccothraustes]